MTFLQRIATPLAIVGAIALTGCLKSNQTFTLYPDGSGKAEIKMTFLGMFAQMVKSGGPQGMGGGDENGGPQKKADPFETLREAVGGKVYWSNLHSEDGADGSFTIAGTGYFDDVALLKVGKKGSLKFKKNDDGGNTCELTLDKDALNGIGAGDAKMTPEQEQQAATVRAMLQSALEGFEWKVSLIMPGAVKSAEGMTPSEGRTAVYAVTQKDLQDIMDKKKSPPPPTLKVVSAAPTGIDEELAKFKKDLAAAKVEDAKTRAADGVTTDEPKKETPPPPKTDGAKPPTDGKKGGDF